jgi:hypothetical protein
MDIGENRFIEKIKDIMDIADELTVLLEDRHSFFDALMEIEGLASNTENLDVTDRETLNRIGRLAGRTLLQAKFEY